MIGDLIRTKNSTKDIALHLSKGRDEMAVQDKGGHGSLQVHNLGRKGTLEENFFFFFLKIN